MGNMKALPMLDHVMLWVARVFTALLLLYWALITWGIYTDYDSRLIYEHTHESPYIVEVFIGSAVWALWIFPWIICTWLRPTYITRAVLCFAAGVIVYVLVNDILLNSPLHNSIVSGSLAMEDLVLPTVVLLGSVSLGWVATRPPRRQLKFIAPFTPINLDNPT